MLKPMLTQCSLLSNVAYFLSTLRYAVLKLFANYGLVILWGRLARVTSSEIPRRGLLLISCRTLYRPSLLTLTRRLHCVQLSWATRWVAPLP